MNSEATEYANETAAQHLVAGVPVARPGESVESARRRLAGQEVEAADAVYVTDERGTLLGLVRLPDLLRADADATLAAVMHANPPSVTPDQDQEVIAGLALEQRLPAVPVVDPGGRFLGVVPPLALIDILRREHIEDLHRLAGTHLRSEQAVRAFRGSPLQHLRSRLPWLLFGLGGSMVATFAMTRFADVLEAMVVVAFFVPGIVYLADAIGTQTEVIAVRGLSLGNGRFLDVFPGEVATGLLIGLALAAVALPAVWLAFGDLRLAATVGAAIVFAGTTATGIGLALPWLLTRTGIDPAFGSGPVATVIQDVLSILIYFVCVRFFLL